MNNYAAFAKACGVAVDCTYQLPGCNKISSISYVGDRSSAIVVLLLLDISRLQLRSGS
jgi:hypothetical protein